MIALAEKSLKYTLKKVHCKRGEPKDPELCRIFATLAPGGTDATVTVPLMQHDNDGNLVQVIESAHCVEYINDIWPNRAPLWPSDPQRRVSVRQLVEVGSSCGFGFPQSTSVTDFPEKLAQHALKLRLLEGCLEKYSSDGGDLLLGDKISIAEVLLGPFVIRWHMIGQIVGFNGMQLCKDLGLNRARRWLQAVVTRPSVVSTYPAPDPTLYRKPQISYSVVHGSLQDVKVNEI